MDSKERLIVLLRYLKDNTDEETEVSAADIRRTFGDLGESVSAPTLRDDIASLQRAKEDIAVREVSGKGTFFKYLGREWPEAELQILIDAISKTKPEYPSLPAESRRNSPVSSRLHSIPAPLICACFRLSSTGPASMNT